MFKKNVLIILVAFLVLAVGVPAYAGHFDFGLLGSRHSVDASIDIEGFELVALVKSQGNRLVVPIDSRGNMTNIGDFELEEARRSYSEISLGYKFGPVIPFVGYSSDSIFTEERKVVENKVTGKNDVVVNHGKETNGGIVFGLGVDQKLGPVGVLATTAKTPNGIYGEVKVKYHISEYLALIGGYVYHPSVNTTGVVAGLGISY